MNDLACSDDIKADSNTALRLPRRSCIHKNTLANADGEPELGSNTTIRFSHSSDWQQFQISQLRLSQESILSQPIERHIASQTIKRQICRYIACHNQINNHRVKKRQRQ